MAARIDVSPQLLVAGPEAVMHDLIDRIVDRYLPVLDRRESEIDQLEEAILTDAGGDGAAERAMHLRHEVAELRESLGPRRLRSFPFPGRTCPTASRSSAARWR